MHHLGSEADTKRRICARNSKPQIENFRYEGNKRYFFSDFHKIFKISSSLYAFAAAVPAKEQKKDGKFVQDPDASRIVCGGEITNNAIITSPGFDDPGHYFNDLDCTWEINIAGVSGFMIYPEHFELENQAHNEDKCEYDSLMINWQEPLISGSQTASPAFTYKFCSQAGNFVWSDLDGSSYTTSTPWVTTTTSTTTEYDYPTRPISYYDYDSSYYYNSKISGGSGSSGYSSFSYSVPSSSYQGRKRRAPVKGTLNESAGRSTSMIIGDFTAPLEVTGGRATLNFKTDSSVVMKGFKLRIEKGNEIAESGCDMVQNGSGTVSSPNYYGDNQKTFYGNNELCKYTLTAEPGKIIKIMFDKFDVEREGQCGYDSLSILGRKHCGKENSDRTSHVPMKTILINSDSTELVWKTDGSVAYGGFSFTWESVDNPVQVASPALESAQGFHDHMELFLNQLVYQMTMERPHMTKALNRFWDKVQITEEYFQSSGNCDWSYSTPNYQTFEFKNFDETVSQCANLRNFANNAKQFVENFVCMDGHEVSRRTFNRWMKMGDKISHLAARKNGFCEDN